MSRRHAPGHRAAATAAALVLSSLAAAAAADPAGPSEGAGGAPWQLEGSLTGRYEYYDVSGDRTQSPYFFTGSEPYGEVRLSLERRLTPWRRLRFQLLGLVNDNDYRNPYDGVVVERASMVYEDGEATMPYRLELGDTFAYFSQRTVQRPVKGLQLEIQAPLGPMRQSLQFVSGLYQQSYRDLDIDRDFTVGASWLVEKAEIGGLAVSYLANRRDETVFLPRRDQRQVSIAGQLLLADRRVAVEGEVSHLRQLQRRSDPRSTEESDEGYFVQVRNGTARQPLLFRLRFERYGDAFRPAGSPIVPDQRAGEAYLGWRFASGLELRGRFQGYRTFLEGSDPLDNNIVGLTLRGPFLRPWVAGLIGDLDLFVQDIDNRSLTTDNRISNLTLNLWKSVRGIWTPRLGLLFRDIGDDSPFDADQTTTEVTLGVDRAVDLGGFSGSIGPSLLGRWVRGAGSSDDWLPALRFNIARGPHSLRQDLGWSSLGRRTLTGVDVDTLTFDLFYQYALRHDTFGFEASNLYRDPSLGDTTTSWRLAAHWTHSLRWRSSDVLPAPPSRPLTGAVQGGPVDLGELQPGTAMDWVRARLEAAGIRNPVRLGNLTTYESTLLDELAGRQQLVLVERDGVLERAALVIESEPASELLRTLVRAREVFISRYGQPDLVFDEVAPEAEGDLGTALGRDAFIRLTEWERGAARLRYGVPRRLDGRVTLELQIARFFPPVRDTVWSIVDARR